MKKLITILTITLLSLTAHASDINVTASEAMKNAFAVLNTQSADDGVKVDKARLGITANDLEDFLLVNKTKDIDGWLESQKYSWKNKSRTFLQGQLAFDPEIKAWFATLNDTDKKSICIATKAWLPLLHNGLLTFKMFKDGTLYNNAELRYIDNVVNRYAAHWALILIADRSKVSKAEVLDYFYGKRLASGNIAKDYINWFTNNLAKLSIDKRKELVVSELEALAKKIDASNANAIAWYNKLLLLKNVY